MNISEINIYPIKSLKGIPLAYLDARDAMERLDDVVGPENWQDRYTFSGSKTERRSRNRTR